jgi:hypothetical protein
MFPLYITTTIPGNCPSDFPKSVIMTLMHETTNYVFLFSYLMCPRALNLLYIYLTLYTPQHTLRILLPSY